MLRFAISAYPTCILRPRRHIAMPFGMEKREWCSYPMVKNFLMLCLFVLTEFTNVTDIQIHKQIDRHRAATDGDNGCKLWQPVQADSQPKSSDLVLGRRPLGAVLHSSNEPGELPQWICHYYHYYSYYVRQIGNRTRLSNSTSVNNLE